MSHGSTTRCPCRPSQHIWLQTGRRSLLTCVLLMLSAVQLTHTEAEQSCYSGYSEHMVCISVGEVSFGCPANHTLLVGEVFILQSPEPGCSPNVSAHHNYCKLEALSFYVRDTLCPGENTNCLVPLSGYELIALSICSEWLGENVLYYSYRCQPDSLVHLSMCDSGQVSASTVFVASDSALYQASPPPTSLAMPADPACTCSLYVSPGSQLLIEQLLFSVAGPVEQAGTCDQRVVLSVATGTLAYMCANLDPTYALTCYQSHKLINIRYENTNSSFHAHFIFKITADNSLDVSCWSTSDTEPPPTFITTTTSTALPEIILPIMYNSSVTAGIITGGILGSLVLIVIISWTLRGLLVYKQKRVKQANSTTNELFGPVYDSIDPTYVGGKDTQAF